VGKLQVSDTEELHFQPLLVRLAVKPNGYNEVKGYKSVPQPGASSGPTPAANGPATSRPAPSPASPAVAHAHQAAGSTAPWKRSA
jgi:hypothetical protein